MPRYVDVEDAIYELERAFPVDDYGKIIRCISRTPTADVVERKIGKWIWMGEQGDSRFMCSVCKSKENVPTIMGKPTVWEYCPNCGAEMDQ